MPEMPEVETVRRLLALRITGARIQDAVFPVASVAQGTGPGAFAAALRGAEIAGIGRRGKYLLAHLKRAVGLPAPPACETDDLIIHLKMRGSLRVEPLHAPPGPYLCAALALDGDRALRFYDMWRWGTWALASAPAPMAATLQALGPEPLESDFTVEAFFASLQKRRGPIKPLLLAQRLVAGLGNIYCDECLHRARLHPARSASSLTAAECARLHGAIRGVLKTAVAQGGAAAERLAEQAGNVDSFDAIYTPRVYDRPGQPCPECSQILIKVSLHGRGTTFCPYCQPSAEPPDGRKKDVAGSR